MENEIRKRLMELLAEKLRRVGVRESELGEKFDLVKSGLVNSLEFVDVIATLEKDFHCEIDYEEALEAGDLTTVGGLVRTFKDQKNG